MTQYSPNAIRPAMQTKPLSEQEKGVMRQNAFSRVQESRRLTMLDQENAFDFHIPKSLIVKAGSQIVSLPIVFGADGDFLMESVTIDFTIPQDSNGGTNSYYKKPSVSMSASDQGRGIVLTDSFVPLHLIASSGIVDATLITPASGSPYSISNSSSMSQPFKWKYFFKATSTLKLEFINLSPIATGADNTANDVLVNINLFGKKVLRA